MKPLELITSTRTIEEIDHKATGAKFRAARVRRGITTREIEAKLNWKSGYLSDLEYGERHWNWHLMEIACKALGK